MPRYNHTIDITNEYVYSYILLLKDKYKGALRYTLSDFSSTSKCPFAAEFCTSDWYYGQIKMVREEYNLPMQYAVMVVLAGYEAIV